MKRVLFAGLALGALAASASAQTIEFRGALCLTSVTAACSTQGWNVGDCVLLRYSPPTIGTNGPGTEVSLLGQSFGDNYSLASGSLVGSTMRPVAGTHVGRTGYTFSIATMRFLTQSPTPSAAAPFVSLTGNINSFNDIASCNVGFRGSATRRP